MKKFIPFLLIIFYSFYVQAQNSLTFFLKGITKQNIKVAIRGNQMPLSWEKSIYLKKKNQGFEITIRFEENINFLEYKYVLEDENGKLLWELDGSSNRLLPIKKGENKVQDTWNILSNINIKDLPKISSEQLQADIKILKEAFLKLHPGTFRYNNAKSFEVNFRKLEESFTSPKTYKEAYKEISRFTATIQCGHTYANFFNQNRLIKNIILNQEDKLPFGFTWFDKRMVIEKNATDNTKIIAGTEILSINGFSASQIADTLMLFVKADGKNDAKRLKDLNVEGFDYYESFDVYFPLCFPPKDGFYHLKLKFPDNSIQEIKVKALTRKKRHSILSKKHKMPEKLDDTWEFKILKDNIGYLKLGTFTVWNFEMNWKDFLKDAFKELEKTKVRNLIVDIRGNEGGLDEVMDVLRNYLWKEDCELKDFQTKIRFNKIPESLRPYISTWDKSLLDMSAKLRQIEDDFYIWKNEPEKPIQIIKKGKKVFTGETYILIDESNSSATMLLSRTIKICKTATLVGQTTGGSKKGINGGNILFLRLPNSKIEVDIPVYGLFDENAKQGGIKPDIEVKRTLKAIIEQRDEILEKVLTLIENK